MKIFGRPPRRFLRAVARGAAYGAFMRSLWVYRAPLDGLVRYVFLTGRYPVDFAIRTDAGPREVRLYSASDFKTLNEVFCRLDYPCTGRERVIIDVGANIGVASLRFLSRCPHARLILFEPDPRNVARLRTQLRGFEGRYELHEKALAPAGGRLRFNTEPSGRLGTLMEPHWHESDLEVIEVEAVGVGDALADVVERYGDVDILKMDVEGLERELIRAVPAELRPRIACIYAELEGEDEICGHAFEQRGSIARYRRREPA